MDRKTLTIKKLKKSNNTSGIMGLIMLPFLAIFIIAALQMLLSPKSEGETSGMLFVFLAVFISIPLIMGYKIIKSVMRQKQENKAIDNGEFKIVEDIINNKNHYTTRSNDRTHHHYDFYTNIYGKVSTDSFSFHNANIGDLIYLVVYNDKNKVDQEYLVKEYMLDNDLRPYLVPYEEALGKLEQSRGHIPHAAKAEESDGTWWN